MDFLANLRAMKKQRAQLDRSITNLEQFIETGIYLKSKRGDPLNGVEAFLAGRTQVHNSELTLEFYGKFTQIKGSPLDLKVQSLGWKRGRLRIDGVQRWGYSRSEPQPAPTDEEVYID